MTGALLGLPGARRAEVVGAVWSTRTVTAGEVKALPARSVVTTRRSYWPSATASAPEAVFHVDGVAVQVPAPGRGALEDDGVEARAGIGGVARERDRRHADLGAVGRRGDRAGREGVVDAHGDRRGSEGVAGVVGRDDAEVVLAVADAVRVPAGGLVRPGAGADRRALELDGRDARAASAELLVSATVSRRFALAAGAVTDPDGFVLSTRTVIAAEVKVLPALSVVTTRRSYWPSVCAVVSQLAAWFVQVPAPIGRALELDGVDARAAGVGGVARQRDRAADGGCVGRERDAARRERVVDPDLHRGRRRLGVSGGVGREDAEVVEAVAEGAGVERGAVRRRRNRSRRRSSVPAPAGERWKVTVLTDPGAVSEAIALSATLVPLRFAPATGTVTEPVGRVRSTVVRTSSVV